MASDALYRLRSKCGSSCPAARGVGLLPASARIGADPNRSQTRRGAGQPISSRPACRPGSAGRTLAGPEPVRNAHAIAFTRSRIEPASQSRRAARSLCRRKRLPSTAATGGSRTPTVAGRGTGSSPAVGSTAVEPAPCNKRVPIVDWYKRFLTGPEVKRFSPAQKLRLAGKISSTPSTSSPSLAGLALGSPPTPTRPTARAFPDGASCPGSTSPRT